MSLQSLVFCTDDKIVRVLRRVLSDLEIHADHCADPDLTIRKLTRQRFEAVIVDCTEGEAAGQILRSARAAPCNKRAIAVALVDGATALGSAFELGAHFVLYKPISTERAKASFRAARALMKRERRRNNRVPVEVPVTLMFDNGAASQRTTSVDISEGGLAVKLPTRPKGSGNIRVLFNLPATETAIESDAQVAWEGSGRNAGIRFVDMAPEARTELKRWLNQQFPDQEKDDPPVSCKLTDLSLGGCYLEMAAPFPVRTLVVLSMRVGQLQVKAEGVVRVLHPERGMGVQFTQNTRAQREHVEKFIAALMKSNGVLPDLLVEPEGLEADGHESSKVGEHDLGDPLLELFRTKASLPADAFLVELSKQRGSAPHAESVLTE